MTYLKVRVPALLTHGEMKIKAKKKEITPSTQTNNTCLFLNRTNIDTIIYSAHSLANGISPGPLLFRAPWQIGGSSRVSTPGRCRVAGQSLGGGYSCYVRVLLVWRLGTETDRVKGEGEHSRNANGGNWQMKEQQMSSSGDLMRFHLPTVKIL